MSVQVGPVRDRKGRVYTPAVVRDCAPSSG